MSTIEQEWRKYRKLVIPKQASLTQKAETKQAFFAGAISILEIVYKLGDSDLTEDEACAKLDMLIKEGSDYAARRIAGQTRSN